MFFYWANNLINLYVEDKLDWTLLNKNKKDCKL